ncbi:hypothetical protein PF005_g12876 [Phytophthora fragariae]|nr:hypothetical protein PF005_g12876 [Phytophthora fragariae]
MKTDAAARDSDREARYVATVRPVMAAVRVARADREEGLVGSSMDKGDGVETGEGDPESQCRLQYAVGALATKSGVELEKAHVQWSDAEELGDEMAVPAEATVLSMVGAKMSGATSVVALGEEVSRALATAAAPKSVVTRATPPAMRAASVVSAQIDTSTAEWREAVTS